jgi:hypothetical protein
VSGEDVGVFGTEPAPGVGFGREGFAVGFRNGSLESIDFSTDLGSPNTSRRQSSTSSIEYADRSDRKSGAHRGTAEAGHDLAGSGFESRMGSGSQSIGASASIL